MISPDPNLGFGATERDIVNHYDATAIHCENLWCDGECETDQEVRMGLCKRCLADWNGDQEEQE